MSHNNDTNSNDYHKHNEAIINYEQELRYEQINSSRHLIDYEPSDTSSLQDEFDNLKFKKIRKTVRDGNCFFRAFIYGLFENMFEKNDKQVIKNYKQKLQDSKSWLKDNNVDEFIANDFYEPIDTIFNNTQTDTKYYQKVLNSLEVSNNLIFYFRMICSTFIRNNSDEFAPFVLAEYDSVDLFCAREVEVLDREADHIHIICLAKYFDIKVGVVYLDNTVASDGNNEANIHWFPSSEFESELGAVMMLYRPGHYDLIYE